LRLVWFNLRAFWWWVLSVSIASPRVLTCCFLWPCHKRVAFVDQTLRASHNTHSFTDAVLSSPPFMPAILSAVGPPFFNGWVSKSALSSVKSSKRVFFSGGIVLKQRKSNAGHTRSRRFRLLVASTGWGKTSALYGPLLVQQNLRQYPGQMSPNYPKSQLH